MRRTPAPTMRSVYALAVAATLASVALARYLIYAQDSAGSGPGA